MPKYIAFLRAINVGGHTVKMDYLRSLFEEMDFKNVETIIASGNVAFDSTTRSPMTLEKKILATLYKELGFQADTFIRTPAELAAIAAYKPFKDEDLEEEGNFLYVLFMAEAPNKAARQKLQALTTPIDEFHVNDREVYWLCRKKISESQVTGAMLGKALGAPTTMRNITTVRKIAAQYG